MSDELSFLVGLVSGQAVALLTLCVILWVNEYKGWW